MNSVRDNYQSTKKEKMITSGSFGEGLEMRGSDIDVMLVRSDIEVSEDTPIYFNAAKVHFTMNIENTKSGYTKLRLHHDKYKIFKLCHEIMISSFQTFHLNKHFQPRCFRLCTGHVYPIKMKHWTWHTVYIVNYG